MPSGGTPFEVGNRARGLERTIMKKCIVASMVLVRKYLTCRRIVAKMTLVVQKLA